MLSRYSATSILILFFPFPHSGTFYMDAYWTFIAKPFSSEDGCCVVLCCEVGFPSAKWKEHTYGFPRVFFLFSPWCTHDASPMTLAFRRVTNGNRKLKHKVNQRGREHLCLHALSWPLLCRVLKAYWPLLCGVMAASMPCPGLFYAMLYPWAAEWRGFKLAPPQSSGQRS